MNFNSLTEELNAILPISFTARKSPARDVETYIITNHHTGNKTRVTEGHALAVARCLYDLNKHSIAKTRRAPQPLVRAKRARVVQQKSRACTDRRSAIYNIARNHLRRLGTSCVDKVKTECGSNIDGRTLKFYGCTKLTDKELQRFNKDLAKLGVKAIRTQQIAFPWMQKGLGSKYWTTGLRIVRTENYDVVDPANYTQGA